MFFPSNEALPAYGILADQITVHWGIIKDRTG